MEVPLQSQVPRKGFWVGHVWPRMMELVHMWVERIEWVNLCHITLRGDAEKQVEQAMLMAGQFEHLEFERLERISFPEAVRHTKGFFLNTPKKLFRPSLVQFLEGRLNYLTPGVVLGLRVSTFHAQNISELFRIFHAF